MNNLLITGGAGFVGTNLVARLSSRRSVTILDTLERSSPTEAEAHEIRCIRGSVLEPSDLDSVLEGIDAVVHLAAYGSVVESVKQPEANFLTNVHGTFNVLDACRRHGIRRLVFASTGGALIGDATPPVDELSLPKPISPYGASKLCGEAYCHAFSRSTGLEAVCLRFGNVYGPHSAHKKGAVTTFIKALLVGNPIVIYGDGTATRDYVYVDDLCRGIESAINADLVGGEVFHLASGRETSVLELAELLRAIAGRPNHTIEFRPKRVGEVARNFASFVRAKDVLDFEPKMSLEAGLEATWKWFVDNKDMALAAATSDA